MTFFSNLFEGMLFGHFEDVVTFFFSGVPYLIIFVLVTNVIFTMLYDIIHIGGK